MLLIIFFIILAETPLPAGTAVIFSGMFWRSSGTGLMAGTVYFPSTVLTSLVTRKHGHFI